MKKFIYPLLLAGVCLASSLQGQSLAKWSLDIDASSSFESNHVTAEDFARGNGIGALDFSGSGAAANAWETDISINEVDYFEVCLSPDTGYDLLVNGLSFTEQRSSNGVRSYFVRWSLDGFETFSLIASSAAGNPGPGNQSYGSDKINVRVCEGETLCIRWYGFFSDTYLGKWSLENIDVQGSEMPVCTPPATPPSNLMVNNASNNSISLSWTAGTTNTIILARKEEMVKAQLCSGNTYGANPTFGQGTDLGGGTFVVFNGSGTSTTVNGLEELETYHFQAVGYSSPVLCYQKNNLPKNSGTTLCGTAPLDVDNLASSPTNGTVALAWDNPNCFDEVLVVASTASVMGSPTSTTGTEYNADANYGGGTDGLGDFSAPEYPVFKGTEDRAAVTGLTNNTLYYFKVFVRQGTSWSAGVEIAMSPRPGCDTLEGDIVFINEIHYRNSGGVDIDQGIEIAGPAGTDLSNYQVYFYNGGGNLYKSFLPEGILDLYGIIDDEGQGYGAVWFPVPGMPVVAGLALYNKVTDKVPEFISYRFNNINGQASVAKDSVSAYIGVQEFPYTDPTESLQRIGNSNCPDDLQWAMPMPSSRGFLNALQQVLPIELLNFKGLLNGNRVLLNWQTISEQNNDYMAVEHSTDAKGFREIGRIKGAGTTTMPQMYQLWHDTPQPGINYYRLRQVDFDGAVNYHGIVAVNYKGGSKGLKVYPAATTGLLTVELPAAPEQRSELAIYDIHGRALQRISLESNSQRKEISVSQLTPGHYFLQWRAGNGELQTERFVKL